MKRVNGLSILFWANKCKLNSSGLVPLYVRVTYQGKRSERSTNLKIDPKKWDAKLGFLKGSSLEVKRVNAQIIEMEQAIQQAHFDLKRTSEFVSAEKIQQLQVGEQLESRMFLEVFDEHNNNMAALVGKGFAKGTLTKYKTIRGKAADFIQSKYNKKDLYLEALEFSFITDFELYLKLKGNVDHNTAMAYIKRVKRIITIAINNRWLSHNPFARFVCAMKKVKRTELESEEIKMLEERLFKVKRLEEVRDCFLFSCYTGYAFIDSYKLTKANIVKGKDGELWINTSRTKTEITANVPLMPRAVSIIEKYANHPLCLTNGKILPLKSNQKMNSYLKEIADLCGITKNLTTHMARHTFATTMTLENDVPIESVSAMLGHTKISTTQLYARVKEKKVSKDMQLLKRKLMENEI